jgi:hypothetical protein
MFLSLAISVAAEMAFFLFATAAMHFFHFSFFLVINFFWIIGNISTINSIQTDVLKRLL